MRPLPNQPNMLRVARTLTKCNHWQGQCYKSLAIRAIHIYRDVQPLRSRRRELLLSGHNVGLVPTMGALHKGHLSLIRHAALETSHIFVSIYVNPTQFGLNEDLDSYPKTWDSDMQKLRELDVELESGGHGRIDAVFAPTTTTMYPTLPPDSSIPGVGTFVTVTPLASLLEGKSRPVFFRGVATVCTKLFNIVEPERVYFGQKDVQQTVVIKRLVRDLHMNTQVRIIPTEREADGLAMSSRNVYLGERRRRVGVTLSRALSAAARSYRKGHHRRETILASAWDIINRASMEQDELPASARSMFEVDYISLADPSTLEEINEVDVHEGAVLSGALKMLPLEETRPGEFLGLCEDRVAVRLIDNLMLDPAGAST